MIKINVSIIIVNYNTKELTLQCLKSIFEQTKNIGFEVIVVDNASVDGTCKAIEEKFPQVKIINSDSNLGFGKANNLGARQASGDFLLLLNSDTILIENSVYLFKEYVETSNDLAIAVVGCNLLSENKQTHVSYGNFPSIYQEIFEFGLSKIFKKFYKTKLCPQVMDNSKQVKTVDYIIGACMFFKKDIFLKFQGFDEKFFLYYEETELCFRLIQAGYKIIWYPNTSVIHYEGSSGKNEKGINYLILEEFYKSKNLFFRKRYGNSIATIIKYLDIPKILRLYRKYETRRILRFLLKIG